MTPRATTLVIPTLHPAFALRGQMQYAQVIAEDIHRAKRLTEPGAPPYQPPGRPLIVTPEANRTEEALRVLHGWLDVKATCAVDVETTMGPAVDPLRCGLRSVAVSAYGQADARFPVGVAFPVGNQLPSRDRSRLLNALAAILDDPDLCKVYHNHIFDVTVLERYGFHLRGPLLDTLVLAHVVDPDLKHDLGFTAQYHLDAPPWKPEFDELQTRKEARLEDLLRYNAGDAICTQLLLDPLLALVDDRNLWPAVEAETSWSGLARLMEANGLPIHRPTRDEFRRRLLTKRDAAFAAICRHLDLPGDALRLTLPSHVRWLFYDRLGLPVRRYTPKTMLPSTSYKGILEHLRSPHTPGLTPDQRLAASVLQHYIHWIESDTDRRTFIDGHKLKFRLHGDAEHDETLWLHPNWNACGQVGTRFTSSPNTANWPPHLRAMVRAPDGYAIVSADESQLEYRVMAALAGARGLLEVFADPSRDAHSDVARYIDPAYDSWPAAVRYNFRLLTKRVVYAMGYGAEAPKITASLREDRRLPVELRAAVNEARTQEIMDGFFARHPEIRPWRDALVDHVNRRGYLEIPPLGRRRYFPRPAEAPKVYNWPVQTLATDVVNLGFLKVQERLPPGAHQIVHAHDEGVWLCRAQDAERLARTVEECLRYELQGPAGSVVLSAEAKITRAWKEDAKWPS